MNKLLKIISKYKIAILIPLFLILILTLLFGLDYIQSRFYIIAKYTKSGPLFVNMPVYYRGYHIGKTQEVQLSENCKSTLVKIVFYPEKPKLREGIVAKVKKFNENKNYIDLVPSDDESAAILKKGSIIDGEAKFDIDAFLSDIADSGLLIPLIQTFSDTLDSINKTSVEVKGFFSDSRLIINDNRGNIRQTTGNLSLSTQSLNKLATRLNSSLTKEKLNNTTSNVDKSSANILNTTKNIENITENVDKATKNLDKTVAKIDCAMSQANAIADNVNAITCGLRNTLGKKFAGMRILFGKPIKNHSCNRHCSK